MKWLLIVWLAVAAGAQEQIKRVTFACEPEDAQVLLQVSGARPYLLGPANQPLLLDMGVFSGRRRVTLTFQRSGWLEQSVSLQQEGEHNRYFDSRDRYPEATQGPVRLTAATGLASRQQQGSYYLTRYRWALLAAAPAFGLGWLALSRLRRQAALGKTLQALVADAPPEADLTGRKCGPYRLTGCIGQGGMAVVYRAVPEGGDEEVAVKVLRESSERPEERKRFLREVKICAALQHPGIVRLYDWGEEGTALYLVMELLQGDTLRGLISKWQVFLPKDAVELLLPAFEALSFAHECQVVHRDIKPDNLFLTQSGLKVMDFGVARGEAFTVATATGKVLGTPAYMAPEQINGKVDPASDQYALGAVLYEMVTGRPVFSDPDPFRIAFMQVWNVPDRPGALRPDLPEWVDRIVLKMLAKDPTQRYANLREVAAELKREAGV